MRPTPCIKRQGEERKHFFAIHKSEPRDFSMHFLKHIPLTLPILLASTLSQCSAILPRAALPGGPISQPTIGSTITAGQPFNFQYGVRNYCESGYSLITVWLLANQPTVDDVTSSGTFADGEYLYEFGAYLQANFGEPVSLNTSLWMTGSTILG